MFTRRHFLALSGSWGILPQSLGAAEAVSHVAYRDYSRCLPDYLRGLAEKAYQLRNREIAKLTTTTAIRARQRWIRENFWKLIGGMPERTPLNARTVGSFERLGYRVEKIIYESRPNFHIPANLYIPTTGKPPYPGVLFQMGHTTNGKAGDLYQRCCQGLTRLGYVVLGFDPMGQGERTYYPGSSLSRSRLGADEEHTYPGRQMILKGDTSTQLQVWDAVRSLDFLASHPLVDPQRLASTGQSGGGTNTMLLAAVDDRLATAAVSCGNTENVACAYFIPPGSTDDAEQNLIGSGPIGLDRWDLLYPLAPKPLLILASEKDFFGTYSPNYISSGSEEFEKLRGIYTVLGRAEQLAWFGTPLPHGLSYDMRLQIYNWFDRWLKGSSRRIEEEPPTEVERDEILFVTPVGNVVQALHGETPFSLNRKRAIVQKPVPLDALLQLERPPASPQATTLGKASSRNAWIEAVEFPSAPKVWVPAWLYLPKRTNVSQPLVIVLEPSGRISWHEGELYDRLAAKGCVVCAPDLRGIGDMTPEFGRGAARSAREHNNEEMYAWSSLIFGRALVGQRVTDILAVVRGLRNRTDLKARHIRIAARNVMTVPALFAAAIEPSIDSLYLAGGLISFESIVNTENYRYPFGNFVPNILKHTDLPQLATTLAPRKVVLAGSVDAAGVRMNPQDVRESYGNTPNVEVIPTAQWEVDAMIQL
jgi:dienelactone hydrolase